MPNRWPPPFIEHQIISPPPQAVLRNFPIQNILYWFIGVWFEFLRRLILIFSIRSTYLSACQFIDQIYQTVLYRAKFTCNIMFLIFEKYQIENYKRLTEWQQGYAWVKWRSQGQMDRGLWVFPRIMQTVEIWQHWNIGQATKKMVNPLSGGLFWIWLQLFLCLISQKISTCEAMRAFIWSLYIKCFLGLWSLLVRVWLCARFLNAKRKDSMVNFVIPKYILQDPSSDILWPPGIS